MSNSRRPTHPAARRPATPRGTQVIVAVVAVLCVVAIVVVGVAVGGGSDDSNASGSVSQEPLAPGECSDAPAPPAAPKSYPAAPDPSLAEDTTWVATLSTSCGDIEVELDGAKAPQTVASFLQLSEDGFYDDTPCHRLTTEGIFVLQCGDPTGSGSGGPGYGYGIENAPKDGSYPTGTLAMARSNDPNSNGSQFFIVYKDTRLPVEGGGYTIFGRVTQGLDIVQSIADKGVGGGGGDGSPAQPISILSVSVEKA
ncbi:MAG: peptidylprolyl isomerase [Nocardioidaceae bacterium]